MEKRGEKGKEAFRTISEVATELDLPQHVLRFWESKFSQIKPMKRGGNRRYYRPDDVEILRVIRKLLHSDGFTIRGVQKVFRENGLRQTIDSIMGPADVTIDGSKTGLPEVSMPASLLARESKILQESQKLDQVVVNKADLQALIAELKDLRAQLS